MMLDAMLPFMLRVWLLSSDILCTLRTIVCTLFRRLTKIHHNKFLAFCVPYFENHRVSSSYLDVHISTFESKINNAVSIKMQQ